jgi:hypothetical protein
MTSQWLSDAGNDETLRRLCYSAFKTVRTNRSRGIGRHSLRAPRDLLTIGLNCENHFPTFDITAPLRSQIPFLAWVLLSRSTSMRCSCI